MKKSILKFFVLMFVLFGALAFGKTEVKATEASSTIELECYAV